jgi:hypothetical protein
MALFSRAVVKTVALDVKPCAHLNFLVPSRPILSKGARKMLFPVFAGGECELSWLRWVCNSCAFAVFAPLFLTLLAFLAFTPPVLAPCILLLWMPLFSLS